MLSSIPLAAVQMVSGPAVAENLAVAERLIAQAASAGAKLIALPEYFPLIGATDAERLAAREVEGYGPIQEFLAAQARRHQIWLVGGSLPLTAHDPAKLRNACLVFSPAGELVARYDKLHLFAFDNGQERYDEGQTSEAGPPRAASFKALGLTIGLAICYDLRFPEYFRALGCVDLVVIPAAFTATTGRAHWELLLRARAVENQCYVLAAAQGGEHPNGRVTYGHSLLVDPWGEVIARRAQGAGIVSGCVDAARIAAVRQQLPALRHRRMLHVEENP